MEIINKIIFVASSWLFILLYQWCTVTQTSKVKYFISAHRNRTTNVMCWNMKLRWRITCLLVHILILSRPVSLHHSNFNARFHAHTTHNVLRHWCRIQDCWKHCIMKLVVNLCISHRFWSKTETFIHQAVSWHIQYIAQFLSSLALCFWSKFL